MPPTVYLDIMTDDANRPHEYPIDGTIDLHQFRPSDTKEIVLEYIRVCQERGFTELRIVHGKGRGVKRDIVRSLLENHPDVLAFRHEGGSGGSWGATVVDLKA